MLSIFNTLALGLFCVLNPLGVIWDLNTSYETIMNYENHTLIYQDNHYYDKSDNKTYDLGTTLYYTEQGIISLKNDGLYVWNTENHSFTCFIKGDFKHISVLSKDNHIMISGTTCYSDDNPLFDVWSNQEQLIHHLDQPFILEIDQNGVFIESHLYSSENSEGFTQAYNINNNFYIAGYKGSGTGALTSQGALEKNTVLYILDHQYHLIKSQVYPHTSVITQIEWDDVTKQLFLLTSEGIIITNEEGGYRGIISEKGQRIDNFKGTLLIWKEDSIEVYDAQYALYLTSLSLDHPLTTIHKNKQCFYAYGATNYLLDIYDARSFFLSDVRSGMADDYTVTTLFGETTFKGESTLDYTPQIDGDYIRSFNYVSQGGINFSLSVKQTIQPYENVVEGGCYPLNYTLHFTGEALLNGIEVFNNYRCVEGTYTLVLTNHAGEDRIIHFSVGTSDYYISDDVGYYDYLTEKNTLTLTIDSIFESVTVIQNNEEIVYPTLKQEGNNTVTITDLDPGYNYLRIKALGSLIMNESLCILNKKEEPQISLSHENDQVIGEISDNDETLRALRIRYSRGQEEYYEIFSLDSERIKLAYKDVNRIDHLTVELLYNWGDGIFNSIPLVSYEVTSPQAHLFNLQTLMSQNHYTRIVLTPAQGLTQATQTIGYMSNDIFYKEQHKPYYIYIILGILLIGGGLGGTLLIKRRKKVNKR